MPWRAFPITITFSHSTNVKFRDRSKGICTNNQVDSSLIPPDIIVNAVNPSFFAFKALVVKEVSSN
jgi:hypothetical protein